MKEIEITCIDCKKKEMRKPQTIRCYACAFKKAGSYHKKKLKPKLVKDCPICHFSFEGVNGIENEYCSRACRLVAKNLEINSHWKEKKLELKYKRKAINEFSTPINQNMQLLNDFDYSRKSNCTEKAPPRKGWKLYYGV